MEALVVPLLAVEVLRAAEAVPAEPFAQVRVVQEPIDPVGQPNLVEDVDQQAGLAIDTPVLDTAHPRRDHRRHVRVGLDPDQTKGLEPHRGHDDDVGHRVVTRGLFVAGVQLNLHRERRPRRSMSGAIS